MCSTSKWTRSVGLYLGGKIFIDMSGELNDQNYLRRNIKLLQQGLSVLEIS